MNNQFNQQNVVRFGAMSGATIPQDFSIELGPILRLVYMWMGLGLLLTAFVALFLSASGWIPSGPVMIGAIIGQLALVLGLTFGLRRLNPTLAALLFFGYSALTGVTFSILFLVYELGAISAAFMTTAGLFGAMTIVGFTTKVDLSRYSTYFMMGLMGLVIAMVVNFFLASSMLDFIISVVGVILFTALTAYDTQKIKALAADPNIQAGSDDALRLSIFGALTLYLDFINLFLFLLRLFGGGRD